jgi:antirestriction protein ArdC
MAQRLKDDKRAIFTAASHAQKAAEHGLRPQEVQS